MVKEYFLHYRPLIKDFIEKIENYDLSETEGLREPFFNYFGKNYFSAQQRIVFIGQDTKWWGDLKSFIESEKKNPLSKLKEGLNSFQKLDFRKWGDTRYQFFGFIMMFFAMKNGIASEEWTVIKQDKYKDLLNSFAWANCQPIELYSTLKTEGSDVDESLWEKIRDAGRIFYGFKHVIETLDPNIVIILHRDVQNDYFEGVNIDLQKKDSFYEHYIVKDKNIHVIKLRHPNNMRWRASEMTAKGFCDFLKDKIDLIKRDSIITMNSPKKTETFKEIKTGLGEIKDKYEFIFALAKYLKEHNMFMSYNGLAEILNYCGHPTENGTPYVVGAKRCRIVSAAFARAEEKSEKLAKTIAFVFVNPDFSYKYEIS